MLTDKEVSNMAQALGISFKDMCSRLSGFPSQPGWALKRYTAAKTNEERCKQALIDIINEIQDQIPRLTEVTAFGFQGNKIVMIAEMALRDIEAEDD